MRSELMDRFSEIIPIGTNKKLEYSFKESINIYSILESNKGLDPIMESLAKIYNETFTHAQHSDIAIINESITVFLESNYEQLTEVTFKKKKRKKRPNSALSRVAKQRWRKNKTSYKKGLKKFHKSSKGKTYHKALSRFNKRNSNKKEGVNDITFNDITELIIAISSAFTNVLLYINEQTEASEDFDAIELIDVLREIQNMSIEELLTEYNSESKEYLDSVVSEVTDLFLDIVTEYEFYPYEDNDEE
ncbi:hypothetical protein Molly5_71 [Maribacter phage Molly_5]|uniref:Uncharacterized protein n=2 Tax=Mollyvirus TaxID=2948826 RepID=A0A8E4XVQ7_9CAUD|nr:hypothetical protein M1M29_gp071 [Maribacter phage Molly_1]YP_010357318.1 hypothetical protein M1M30_gp069 [Maribacter phage Colly_1]QQO97757.1 hypothetical protein Molly2_71 [Maribacter phage Molly_2]QQO97957.1 hypothetical protein Molly3_71 [Maribacter phage Molly_3]QQO98157.1 hypothetical protein Molly4_71 [Maribacter phage Molly_4]QQO98357.1 hypothetical protein Molly5_71 [Maribacter phage Molly_5]QQO97354.1 hypothetical protein Colly1_69 [Maribacter phage Colly_1]